MEKSKVTKAQENEVVFLLLFWSRKQESEFRCNKGHPGADGIINDGMD